MKLFIKLLIVAVFAVTGTVGFAYSGFYDVSATSSHSAAVNWLLSATSQASIGSRAAAVAVPDLSDAAFAHAGDDHHDHAEAGSESDRHGLAVADGAAPTEQSEPERTEYDHGTHSHAATVEKVDESHDEGHEHEHEH